MLQCQRHRVVDVNWTVRIRKHYGGLGEVTWLPRGAPCHRRRSFLWRLPWGLSRRTPQEAVPLWPAGNCQITRGHTKVTKKHSFSKSLVAGTWFDKSKLSQQVICRFCSLWLVLAHPRTVLITRELCVTKKTVIDWSSFCREVCQFWLEERYEVLGGEDIGNSPLHQACRCRGSCRRERRYRGGGHRHRHRRSEAGTGTLDSCHHCCHRRRRRWEADCGRTPCVSVQQAADQDIRQFRRLMTGPDQHCVTNTHVTRGQLGNRTADLVEYVVVGVYDDHLCVALSAVPMPTLYALYILCNKRFYKLSLGVWVHAGKMIIMCYTDLLHWMTC